MDVAKHSEDGIRHQLDIRFPPKPFNGDNFSALAKNLFCLLRQTEQLSPKWGKLYGHDLIIA